MNETEVMNALGTCTRFFNGSILAICPVCELRPISISMVDAPCVKIQELCSGGCSQEEVLSALKERCLLLSD